VTQHHKIVSLTVNGGFLQGAHFDFSDGLNCIIGGRGTGKTTALEFIRHALDRLPHKSDDKSRHQQINQIIKHNLLHGTVELHLETKDGTQYTVSRASDGPPTIIGADGSPVNFDLRKDTIFGVEIYSQSEIEDIANTSRFQLDLIDKFTDGDLALVKQDIQKASVDLERNGRLMLENSQRRVSLREKLREMPDLQERLRSLSSSAQGQQSSLLEDAHRQNRSRLRERAAVADLVQAHDVATKKIQDFSTSLESLVSRAHKIEEDMLSNAATVHSALEISKASLERATASLREAAENFTSSASLLVEHQTQLEEIQAGPERAYQELLAKHERAQKQGAERVRIEKQLVQLERVAKELEEADEQCAALLSTRLKVRNKLSQLRDQRFACRAKAASYLNSRLNPTIQVTLREKGNKRDYLEAVRAAMKGGGFHYTNVSASLVERVPPEELARIVHERDVSTLARDLDLEPDRAERIIAQLATGHHMHRIETVELHDEPSIKLHDGEYKDSSRLSTGQKCTVILPILLLDSDRVLLIDQPEDNLDNAFIFKTVVKALRGCEGVRQMIFITHNPNIPVLGDAARVFCLHSTGKAAAITSRGNVDEVAADLIRVLEGGRDAFEARRERYGALPPQRLLDERSRSGEF